MDRLFLDANTLFSAAWGSPSLARLWCAAGEGRVRFLSSAYAVDEARRNLSRQDHLARFDELLSQVTVVPERHPAPHCPVTLPAKDRPILVAAMYCNATHLLTGDHVHFGPLFGQTVGGVFVTTVREYLM